MIDFTYTLPLAFLAMTLALVVFALTKRDLGTFRKTHHIALRVSAIGIVLAIAGGLSSAAHADGINWTTQTSAADNNWASVTWGGPAGQEKFVAVSGTGSGNRVMTSPDGINWTTRTSATDSTWFSVTWGNGLFVAVGSSYISVPPPGGFSGRVMTSPDGINWTTRTSATDNDWRSVTWGGPAGQEKFVAVSASGTSNRVMTSPDGINWTTRTSATDNNWRSVTWGNGLFVAVSASGTGDRVMTSPDGINWTTRTSATDNNWWSVTWGGPAGQEKFVAVSGSGSGNRVMTSPDGINWTTRTSATDNNWASVTWGGPAGQEKFVAVSLNGTGDRVMTSGGVQPITTTTAVATTTTAISATTTVAPSTTTMSSPTVTQPSATIVRSLPVKEIVSSDNVTAGSSVKLIAGGFTPSESVLVGVLGSTDTPSQVTADSRGAIATKVSIPTDAAGKVTVYAYGQTSKRGFRQVVTVEASKTLPATGSDSSPLTLFGVALLATGMLFTARRRLTR